MNLAVGYHVHAVTDCLLEIQSDDGHAAEIGLAMDGYPLHMMANLDGTVPDDLDACRGHETAELGYHYHVGAAGSNEILGCHTGQTGCVVGDPDATCNAAQPAFSERRH